MARCRACTRFVSCVLLGHSDQEDWEQDGKNDDDEEDDAEDDEPLSRHSAASTLGLRSFGGIVVRGERFDIT